MIIVTSDNYSKAVETYMDLAVQTKQTLTPMPRLQSVLMGEYSVGVELDKPYFRYRLKVARRDLTLHEVRQLEAQLQTKLLAA